MPVVLVHCSPCRKNIIARIIDLLYKSLHDTTIFTISRPIFDSARDGPHPALRGESRSSSCAPSRAETVRVFFEQNPSAVRASSFLIFASAVPFGIFAVTMVSRLRFLGVRAAGTNIALLGGLMASNALILSGLFGWVLSWPDVAASASLVRAIYSLSFLFGGAAYAVGFGLLAAGVCVTSYFFRLLPRWVIAIGMLVAVAGEFSSLSLVVYPANFLIPITRYVGFIWLLLAAVKLTKIRKPE
jgi:hypothetical protein